MKRKVGLHKKISAIFDGIPIPKDGQMPPDAPPPPAPPPSAPPADVETPVSVAEPPAAPETPIVAPAVPEVPIVEPEPTTKLSDMDFSDSQLNFDINKTIADAPPEPAAEPKHQNPVPEMPVQIGRVISAQDSKWTKMWNKICVSAYGTEEIDTRQKLTIVAMPVLVIVLIFVFKGLYFPSNSQDPTDLTDNNPIASALRPSKIEWTRPQITSISRDPMRYASGSSTSRTRSGSRGQMQITSIIIPEDGTNAAPLTIIDGETLTLGDKIEGLTIVKINKDSVEFKNKNGEIIVHKQGKGR